MTSTSNEIADRDVARLEDMFYGSAGSASRVDEIERLIAEKFGEIRRLAEEASSLASQAGGRIPSDQYAERLRALFPLMSVSVEQDGRELRARRVTVGVEGAPYFIYSGSEEPLYVTAPANTVSLRLDRDGVSGAVYRATTWNEIRSRYAEAGRWPADLQTVSFNNGFQHPHVSGDAPNTNQRGICWGSQSADPLISRTSTQGSMTVMLRRLYSWLTEINADSTFHSQTTPVRVRVSLTPPLAMVENMVCHELASDTHKAIVESLRTTGAIDAEQKAHLLDNVLERLSRAISSDSEVATGGAGQLILGRLAELRTMLEPVSPELCGNQALAIHRYLCAMHVMSRQRGMRSLVENAALADLVVIPMAYRIWVERRGDPLRLTSGDVSVRQLDTVRKMLSDYNRYV